jgi:murein DD-endopeptidase MepM/ murein hydrolase activator NlpD
LFLTLQARPGPLGVVLWKWGPPTLVFANALLLGAALVSALRDHQTFSLRRTLGFAGLCLLLATTAIYRTYPSSYDDAPSEVDFLLPFDGPITVAWGGPTSRSNYHVGAPAERWAYDLLVTKDGASYQGTGSRLTDYYAYDRPVTAPAVGRVAVVHDGDPDATPGQPLPQHGGGNRVVIEVAPDQYLTLAHLKAGTIRVAPGQQVKPGDRLGRVGNSGNSSEPHLHLHLQDTLVPGSGEGIPLYFSRYVVLETGAKVARGMPQGGMRRGRYVGDVAISLESPGMAEQSASEAGEIRRR